MASILLSGNLRDSLNEIDVGGIIRFTHLSATGDVIPSTQSELIVSPDGEYSIRLNYGRIRIDYTTKHTERYVSTVVVNQDTEASSIGELLNAFIPVVGDDVILEMQGILADTTEQAQISADAAQASQDNVSRPNFSVLDNPLTHLFKKNKLIDTLDGELSVRRTTEASYFDRYGKLRTSQSDELRGVEKGWLIEDAATNVLTYSSDFTDPSWVKVNSTVAKVGFIGVDERAEVIEISDTSADSFGITLKPLPANTFNAGETVTMSVILKQGTSNESVINITTGTSISATINWESLDDSSENLTIEPLFDGWYLFSISAIWVDTPSNVRILPVAATDGGFGTVFCNGVQLESGDNSSSYILTGDSPVTRAADEVSASVLNNIPSANKRTTITATIQTLNPNGLFRRAFDLRTGIGSFLCLFSSSANALIFVFGDVDLLYNYGDAKEVNIACVVDDLEVKLYVNGALVNSAPKNLIPDLDISDSIHFSSPRINTSMLDFRIYDTALNASQIQFLHGEL